MYKFIDENTKKKIYIISILIIIIIVAILFLKSHLLAADILQNKDEIIENTEIEPQEIESSELTVYITGEVNTPGVITLDKQNNRIINAVEKAGGTTSKADLESINLAEIIEDGVHIHIPKIDKNNQSSVVGGVVSSQSASGQSKDNSNKKININSASAEELQKLSGIGASLSERIVDYRNNNGKFKTVDDLKKVNGIGDSKFNNLKANITV